jgi:hypothetical protein
MGLYDLGELSTTVTAQSGSTVTLASVTGLVAGDSIIIESQHGYNETGLDGDWAITNIGPIAFPTQYYLLVDHVGKSFISTIVSIAGLVVTVDRTVPSGAVGLPCYRNNHEAVMYAINNKLTWPSGKTLACASSNTAPMRGYLSDLYHEIDFRHCTLFAPRGCGALGLAMYRDGGGGVSNKVYRNLTLRGNARDAGYGILAETGEYIQGSSFNYCFGIAGTGGGGGNIVSNIRVENFTFIDVWQSIAIVYATDSFVVNCRTTRTEPLRSYVQWEYQTSLSSRCGFVDCVVDSDFMTAGFEPFQSIGISFIRCGGRNTAFSCNSSGSSIFKDCYVTIDDVNPDTAFSANNPIVNINRTIEEQQGTPYTASNGGVRVQDMTVTYNEIPYPSTDRIFNTITVAPPYQGIAVKAEIKGITVTVPRTNVTTPNAGYVVRSDAPDTTVTGMVATTLDSGSKYVLQNIPQGE